MIHSLLRRPVYQTATLQLVNSYTRRYSVCVYQATAYRKLGELKMSKIDTPQFHSIFTPELIVVTDLFKKYGHELRIAGGAVRDLLLGEVPDDIDFATTATPDQIKIIFEEEEIRMLNKRGEKHGTITARINDKVNFEVTTLRIDILTNGRHAEVEFTKDWQLDANRRDLTINSMFLGIDGTLYDYFNGKEDLEARRVRFVGDAAMRIQEDYLRILRYFRFFGRISNHPDSHESCTLNAIKENADGLARISGERIWTELQKIVVGRFAPQLTRYMSEVGILEYMGLPKSPPLDVVNTVYQRSTNLNPMPITVVSSLLRNEHEMDTLHKRLKLSNEDLKTALFVIGHRDDGLHTDSPIQKCQDFIFDNFDKDRKIKKRLCELFKYLGQDETLLKELDVCEVPTFPITGIDLLEKGVQKGPGFMKVLQSLRQFFKESGYSLAREDLIREIDKFVSDDTRKT